MKTSPVDAALIEALTRAERPLITSHMRLDGDGLGSMLGLHHLLRDLGRRPRMVVDSAVPKIYAFLPGADEVRSSPDAVPADADLVVCLDVADRARLRRVAERLPRSGPLIKIDHHVGGEIFGDLDWVDAHASSVGEMLCRIVRQAGWTVTPEVATCLHVAIMTDTGRFCFANTTPEAMDAAAFLLERGADLPREVREIYRSQEPGLIRLRGMTLQSLRLSNEGRVAWMCITRDMFEETGTQPIDTQEFADLPRAVAGVRAGVLLRELPPKRQEDGSERPAVKVSLRSADDLDVRAVAVRFGGGGHTKAAGCEIEGSVAEVQAELEAEIAAQLPA